MNQPDSAAQPAAEQQQQKVGIGAYLSFIFACVFFSGVFASTQWWGIFDYTVLLGNFGNLLTGADLQNGEIVTTASSFRGKGGSGAIDGFMFAFTLVPAIILSVAMVDVFEHYGALRAAERLLNPILRPLMGIPGSTSLSMIASLQSTDAGAALTRTLYNQNRLTERELLIYAAFQMTAGAAIGNFLSSGIALFAITDAAGNQVVPTTIGACLIVLLLGKVFAANLMRVITSRMKLD